MEGRASCYRRKGEIRNLSYSVLGIQYTYYNELNAESYVVESPDAIEPATNEAFTILRYSENNLSAGIAYKGKYKTFVTGFRLNHFAVSRNVNPDEICTSFLIVQPSNKLCRWKDTLHIILSIVSVITIKCARLSFCTITDIHIADNTSAAEDLKEFNWAD